MAERRGIWIPNGTDPANVPQSFSQFVDSAFPTGIVQMFMGSPAPAGWLLCNGIAIPAGAEYDALRALCGPNTPDFSGRAPAGPGGGGPVGLNEVDGARTVQLAPSHMPSHNHGPGTGTEDTVHEHAGWGQLNIVVSGGGITAIGGLSSSGTQWGYPNTHSENRAHAHGVHWAGGDQGHQNVSPVRTINFIIKV